MPCPGPSSICPYKGLCQCLHNPIPRFVYMWHLHSARDLRVPLTRGSLAPIPILVLHFNHTEDTNTFFFFANEFRGLTSMHATYS